MPGRYLNFGAMTFVALLIGLLGSRRELWSRLVLLFLTCGLLAGDHSMLWEFLEHHHNVLYQSNITAAAHRVDRDSRAARRRRVEEQSAEMQTSKHGRCTHRTHCTRCTYRTCSCSPSSC